ncbi:OsmC family protein [Allobranchiibius sp. CTAmp26]|uniref:OsmC family protein n=1 Tax=Allobranchiibius sp. CTAmp26 TaxID=2815214 RepID=UPI001FB5D858|nr:OsmC family protein [Allobranchiibius sp. CTAmp26]
MVTEHRYAARLSWAGSTGIGYDHYPREHQVVVAGDPLRMSSDPHFGGDPESRNPEQLLVMAASSCQLLSFLAVAARARLDVVAYDDDAVGLMTEGDGPAWVESIELRPRIELAPGSRTDRMQRLVEIAHRECFIARSLRSGMKIEATVVVEGQDVVVVQVADAAAPRVEPQRG